MQNFRDNLSKLAYLSMEKIVDEHFSQNFRFDEPGLKQNKRNFFIHIPGLNSPWFWFYPYSPRQGTFYHHNSKSRDKARGTAMQGLKHGRDKGSPPSPYPPKQKGKYQLTLYKLREKNYSEHNCPQEFQTCRRPCLQHNHNILDHKWQDQCFSAVYFLCLFK